MLWQFDGNLRGGQPAYSKGGRGRTAFCHPEISDVEAEKLKVRQNFRVNVCLSDLDCLRNRVIKHPTKH